MSVSVLAGAAGFAGYLALIMAALRITSRPPAVVVVWTVSVVYWFAVISFLMGFGALYKSISLRILADLLERAHRAERYEAILRRYIHTDSFHDRLRVIVSSEFAKEDAGRYALTAKGKRLVQAAHALQRLFRIEKSG
jgi:hypothetical protein